MSNNNKSKADAKPLKWTVEFTVTENWVEDGFNLDDERALAMLANDLSYAYGYELGARVVKSPDISRINKLQGVAQ